MSPTNSSEATYFPLRWESTGDKWWYASPIDWAAANAQYDVVLHLLLLDPNHLISLTSLRRLRRLESLWDDHHSHSFHAAKNRSSVARRLLQDSSHDLIASGYGGWLLYTAASAADLGFVNELLRKDPLLVFGEGEYGLTDMLYAAARSKSPELFWVLYDFAVSPRFENKETDHIHGPPPPPPPRGFKWEVVNRAVHAAARGGSLGVLVELLGGGGGGGDDGVLGYRDACGSTVLHAAAGRGQVEVVKYLIASYGDIVSSTDNEGNTALHVAAYKGHFSVVEVLLNASPSSISATNKAGNTVLHMTVAGALSPGFRRVDRQVELMRQLTTTKNDEWNIQHIINAKNGEGRTALHMAIMGSVHSSLVENLMAARCINVNIRDDHGMTPLDHLRQQPRSLSSEMLIRQLISAGGMSNCQDYSARKAIASHLRMQGSMCSSPGTAFRVLDSEIFRYSGIEHARRGVKIRHLSSPGEISLCRLNAGDEEQNSEKYKKHGGSVQSAAKRLKNALQWPKMMKKKKGTEDENDDDVTYAGSHKKSVSFDETPIPLRERFSGSVSVANNKRTLAARSNISSPTNKKKFAFDTVQDLSHVNVPAARLSSSSLSKTSISSRRSLDKEKWGDDVFPTEDDMDEAPHLMHKQRLVNKRLVMNQYLCFGGSSLSVKNPLGLHQRNPSNGNKQPIQAVACN